MDWTSLPWFRTLVVLIGVACCGQALRLMWRRRAALRHPVRATGKVLKLVRDNNEDGPDWYAPIVQFSDEEGIVHEQQLPYTKDTRSCAVGSKVQIVYERGNPRNIVDPAAGTTETIAHLLLLSLGAILVTLATLAEVVPAGGE